MGAGGGYHDGYHGFQGELVREHRKVHLCLQLEIYLCLLMEVLLLLLSPFGEFLVAFGYLIENKHKLDTSNLLVFSDK